MDRAVLKQGSHFFKSEVFILLRNSKTGMLRRMVKTISGGKNLMLKIPPPMIVMSVYEIEFAFEYSLYIMKKLQKLKTRLKIEANEKATTKRKIKRAICGEFKSMVEFKISRLLDSPTNEFNKKLSKFGTFFDIKIKDTLPTATAVK